MGYYDKLIGDELISLRYKVRMLDGDGSQDIRDLVCSCVRDLKEVRNWGFIGIYFNLHMEVNLVLISYFISMI